MEVRRNHTETDNFIAIESGPREVVRKKTISCTCPPSCARTSATCWSYNVIVTLIL